MSGHSRPITTEIEPLNKFYPAEEYHQQYLQKVPNGYCNLAGTGVACPLEFALLALLNDDAVLPLESVIR